MSFFVTTAPTTPAVAGSCFYPQLTSGEFQAATYSPQSYTFVQSHNYWTAVAVRPFPGTDWDLRAYADSPFDPGCTGSILASSVGGTSVLDFIVGDFNHNPLGTYHVTADLYAGNGIGIVEWDSGEDQIPVNGGMVTHYTHEWDPIQVWDVLLQAGTTYYFSFLPDPGLPFVKIWLFGNPANAPLWLPRGQRLVESSTGFSFTPSTTDWYGVVVTNESGYRGNYSIAASSCTAPVAMSQFGLFNISPTNAYFSFGQAHNFWSAVGVRSPAHGSGADWDLALYQTGSGAGPPACYTGTLASSVAVPPRVDFVIGDFNASPLGTYYVRPYLYSGTAGARVDWDSGEDEIVVNGPAVGRNVTGEVLEVWDVLLLAGQTYTFHFTHPPSLDSKLLLFQNPGGTYFTNRSGALFEADGTTTFTAPATQYYGLVVVHDGDTIGENFFVAVSTCPPLPELTSADAIPVASPSEIYRFTQYNPYWAGVGVRSASNWNLQINESPSGGTPPICVSGTIAGSFSPGPGVDFAIGDFNHNLRTEQYVTFSRPSGTDAAVVEWDDGTDSLDVGAPPVTRTTGADDVLEVWDVELTLGQAYEVFFQREGEADTRFYLYRSFNGSFWGFPSTSVLQGTSHAQYTAPTSDRYGIVVVNNNGLEGRYHLGVYPAAVAADPGPLPARPALNLVRPNPGSGPLTFHFDLNDPETVEFDVVDLAGRLVARVPPREWAAGSWTYTWDGRADLGSKPSAGIYFVRMKVKGQTVGSRKVAIVS